MSFNNIKDKPITSNFRKKENIENGSLGEKTAEKYLKRRGYLIIGRNYWTEFGEIDIICLKGRTLVFVEVKTRTRIDYGTGREAVNFKKQNNIKKSSEDFISECCESSRGNSKKNKVPFYFLKFRLYFKFKKVRYDVIEVVSKRKYNTNVSCDVKKNYSFHIGSHIKSFFK